MADIDVVPSEHNRRPVVERTGFRLSWGAVFAGFVVAISIQIVLSLFGIAIGFAAWDVGDPASALGIGAAVWAIASMLIALFVGGTTAGRLAGVLTRGDGAVHGVLVWGLAVVTMFAFVVSGAGVLLGGTFSVLGRTVAATTGAAVSGVTEVTTAAASEMTRLDFDQLESSILGILQETERPALQPDTLEAAAQRAGETALGETGNQQAAAEIADIIEGRAGAIDRGAILNVLAARTDLSREEADRVVTRIENAVQSVSADVGTAVDTLGAEAEEFAQDATEAASTAAWWVLLGMLLSAGAAAAGAAVTARQ